MASALKLHGVKHLNVMFTYRRVVLLEIYFTSFYVRISKVAVGGDFMCLLTDRGILMTKGSGQGGCLGHGNEVLSIIEPYWLIIFYFLLHEV